MGSFPKDPALAAATSAASPAAHTSASRTSIAALGLITPTAGMMAMNRVKSFARVWSSREEAAFAKRSSRRRIAAPAHSSTNAGDDALSKPRSAAYTGVLTGSSSTHSSRKRVAGSVSAGKSLASRPARFRVISGDPSQWMMASRISLGSRSAALTGGTERAAAAAVVAAILSFQQRERTRT